MTEIMDVTGLEPVTSSLQRTCAPSCATRPDNECICEPPGCKPAVNERPQRTDEHRSNRCESAKPGNRVRQSSSNPYPARTRANSGKKVGARRKHLKRCTASTDARTCWKTMKSRCQN